MIVKAQKMCQRMPAATYLLLVLHLLGLLGLGASVAVAAVQPEDDMHWGTHSGQVTAVAAGGPAAQAGLRIGYQILTIDGLPLAALPDATNGKRATETLSVTMRGDGEILTVSLTLQQPSFSTLLDRLIPLGVGLGFGIIGLATCLLAPRQPLAALFALECLAVAGVLAAGTLSTFKIPLASRLFNACLALVAALGLHLHLRFPRARGGPAARWVLRVAYGLAGSFALFFLLPGWMSWRWQPWYPNLRWGLRLALGLSLAGQVALLVTAARADHACARRHMRLLAAGAALGVAPFLLTALLPELFTGRPWWPYQYTFPFLLTLPLAYGYTLARARLCRWDRAVARLLAAASAGILLLSTYGLAVQRLDVQPAQGLPAVLALAAGLAFWPLARAARRATDWVLFDIRYDYASVVSSLGEELARALDRPTLRHLLVEQLPEVMPFEGAALLLARQDSEDGNLCLEPPSTLPTGALAALPGEGTLARTLAQQKGLIATGELCLLLAGAPLSPAEATWLGSAAVETWLPLARKGELLGILLLGARSGGDLLDGQDRRILCSVAHQAALAAENVRLADALRASQAELARAHGQLILAREDERRQLAWSLHDGPTQDLMVISHRLAALGTEVKDHAPELAELRRAVVEQIHTLRQLYIQLRPGTLDELGLRGALRALAIECEDMHGLAVIFHTQGDVDHLPDVVAVTLFRVAQEALANAARHSGAGQAWLELIHDDRGIILTITDDGQGFQVPQRLSALAREGHFGLLGMVERLKLVGGRLEVHSQPGEGTTLQTWLPAQGQGKTTL